MCYSLTRTIPQPPVFSLLAQLVSHLHLSLTHSCRSLASISGVSWLNVLRLRSQSTDYLSDDFASAVHTAQIILLFSLSLTMSATLLFMCVRLGTDTSRRCGIYQFPLQSQHCLLTACDATSFPTALCNGCVRTLNLFTYLIHTDSTLCSISGSALFCLVSLGSVSFSLADLDPFVYVLVFGWPVVCLLMDELCKRAERRWFARYQRELKLEFDTRLGRYSPK